MFKDFLINYGFESNSNELHTTWVRNRTINTKKCTLMEKMCRGISWKFYSYNFSVK